MRFLILSLYFPPEVGAPQTRLDAMSRELIRLGHKVEVVTALPNYPEGCISSMYRGTAYRCEQWNGMPVHRVWVYARVGRGVLRLLNYLSFTLSSVLGLLRAKKADYVFVESPPLFLGLPGFVVSRLRGASFIFNVSDLWPDSVRQLGIIRSSLLLRAAEILEHWTYRKASYVVAVTEGIRKGLLEGKGVPAEKVLFLPNGVDTELFRPGIADIVFKRSLGLEGKRVILYQGSEGYAHNLESVLHCAKLLAQARDIHFLFVGNGSSRTNLERLTHELNLDNVTFLNPVRKEELPRFFAIAECGLVSLRALPLFEGARPAKTLPILSSGKPVLYVGEGEGARLILDAQAGIVVPPGDPEALAAAVRTLLGDPELAARMGQSGRVYVEQHLRWRSLVEKWVADLMEPDAKKRGYRVGKELVRRTGLQS